MNKPGSVEPISQEVASSEASDSSCSITTKFDEDKSLLIEYQRPTYFGNERVHGVRIQRKGPLRLRDDGAHSSDGSATGGESASRLNGDREVEKVRLPESVALLPGRSSDLQITKGVHDDVGSPAVNIPRTNKPSEPARPPVTSLDHGTLELSSGQYTCKATGGQHEWSKSYYPKSAWVMLVIFFPCGLLCCLEMREKRK